MKLRITVFRRIGIGGGVVCGILAVAMAVERVATRDMLVVGAMLILAAGLVAYTPVIEYDSEQIRWTSRYGHYRMLWDDVRFVEVDPQGLSLVWHGEKRRLAMVGPAYWIGPGSSTFREALLAELKSRGLDVREDPRAFFRFSKKTRTRQ